MTKIAGSGSESRSITKRYGSADPDPHHNVMNPEHWFRLLIITASDQLGGDPGTLWIRIHMDRYLFGCPGSRSVECGSGSRSMEIDQNEQINLPLKRPLCLRRYRTFMSFDLLLL
jgi:hypothetical protein